jgi:hypothetical protein
MGRWKWFMDAGDGADPPPSTPPGRTRSGRLPAATGELLADLDRSDVSERLRAAIAHALTERPADDRGRAG